MMLNMNWRKHDLSAGQIATWTGNSQDALDQDEIFLAGCLYNPGNIDTLKGVRVAPEIKHLIERGRKALWYAVINGVPKGTGRVLYGGPSHTKAAKKALRKAGNKSMRSVPLRGMQLTPLALDLQGAVRLCREKMMNRPRGLSPEASTLAEQQYREFSAELQKAIGAALEREENEGES